MGTTSTTHILRVWFQNKRSISREIEFPSDKKLYDLAEAIVWAFGFDFDHPFGFYSKLTGREVMRAQPKYELFADMEAGSDAKSVKRTRVATAFPQIGHKMLFLFDYGDEWRFVVEVIGFGQKVPRAPYPKLLKQTGKAPKQYGEWDEDDEEAETAPVRRPD
jgi:hypothetical protein